jgi:hypothetical protein
MRGLRQERPWVFLHATWQAKCPVKPQVRGLNSLELSNFFPSAAQ